MPIDAAESAVTLVRSVLPIIVFWFDAGFIIAVLYHLALPALEGEFTKRDELALDTTPSMVRFAACFLA